MVLAQFSAGGIQRIDQGTIRIQTIRREQVDHDRRVEHRRFADRQGLRLAHAEIGVIRHTRDVAATGEDEAEQRCDENSHWASSPSLSGSGERSS